MKRSRQEIVEQNRVFARKWDGLWVICCRSLGKIDSKVDSNGDVLFKWREDSPVRGSSYPQGYPERAKDRSWTVRELLLSDASLFLWSELQSRDGAIGRAANRHGNGTRSEFEYVAEISLLNDVELKIQSNTKDEYKVEAQGEGPIVINSLLPLVLGEVNHQDNAMWPIRFLGVWIQDEKDLKSWTWLSLPCKAKYLGQVVQPLQQGHL